MNMKNFVLWDIFAMVLSALLIVGKMLDKVDYPWDNLLTAIGASLLVYFIFCRPIND
jgi:hypothetical protein